MLFNSFEYLVFFTVALAASWMLVGLPRLRIWVLLVASYYFYISNNYWLITLIVVSTQVDYLAGRWIEDTDSSRKRKRYLGLSIMTNLGILAVFKYFNFFAGTFAEIAATVGLTLDWVDLKIALPVGISFYTFQSMSYTIDVYRGEISAERNWFRFAFYVSYFPQLVAGPIVRASQFLPQIPRRPGLDVRALEWSLLLIARGLVKKIVLADLLAGYADRAFSAPASIDGPSAWIGLYAFTFQIYFDFSGYSDIAIGCSRLMGYEIPENFRRPYVAATFSDFWRRWHISLSSWLRDYVYIPLGGNRGQVQWLPLHFFLPGAAAVGFLAGCPWAGVGFGGLYLLFLVFRRGAYNNLMLTMLLGGLWHGAACHFVLWGFLHGGYLLFERLLGVKRKDPTAGHQSLLAITVRRLLVFHAVVLTWLFFRCPSMPSLASYLVALTEFSGSLVLMNGEVLALAICACGLASQYLNEFVDCEGQFLRLPIFAKSGLYAVAALAVLIMNSTGAKPFIYFQF